MLRPRQIAKLVAFVPVSTTTVSAANAAPADTTLLLHQESSCGGVGSIQNNHIRSESRRQQQQLRRRVPLAPPFRFSTTAVKEYASKCACVMRPVAAHPLMRARQTSNSDAILELQSSPSSLMTEPGPTDLAIASRRLHPQFRVRTPNRCIQYTPNAFIAPSTDGLLGAIEDYFGGGPDAERRILNGDAVTDPQQHVVVRQLGDCTNQVFQLGEVAIFKPQGSATGQSTDGNGHGAASEGVPQNDHGETTASDTLETDKLHVGHQHQHTSADRWRRRRQHPQRCGIFDDEEPVREVAAFALDQCQGSALRCGVPATATVQFNLRRRVTHDHDDNHTTSGSASNGRDSKAADVGACTLLSSVVSRGCGTTKMATNYLFGTVHAFQPNIGAADNFGDGIFTPLDVQRIAILDIRLFNTDRHGGNLLLADGASSGIRACKGGPSGENCCVRSQHLVPIDHGLCLPDIRAVAAGTVQAEFAWAHWQHARSPVHEELAAAVATDVNAEADAQLLRRLGVRESCVATNLLATLFLQWALACRTNVNGAESTTIDYVGSAHVGNHHRATAAWTLADIARFMHAPPNFTPWRSGDLEHNVTHSSPALSPFAQLLSAVLQKLPPPAALVWTGGGIACDKQLCARGHCTGDERCTGMGAGSGEARPVDAFEPERNEAVAVVDPKDMLQHREPSEADTHTLSRAFVAFLHGKGGQQLRPTIAATSPRQLRM